MESVSGLLDRVEGGSYTLTVYNHEGPPEEIETLTEHFGRRNTSVRTETTESRHPTDVAVLHDGDRFLAASPVEPAYRAIEFDAESIAEADITAGSYQYPSILEHVATTAFTSYDKRRMIIASREIETRAWRLGRGELRSGFQQLSVMGHQESVYRKLAAGGVDVHAYGVPDSIPGGLDELLTIHPASDEEIKASWFVVFDGDGEDEHKAALISEERAPGEFYGFWTYEPTLVDEVFSYLHNGRTSAPPAGPGETGNTAD